MTNNTIANVPRELLERASNLAFQTQHYPLHEELRTLLSAPSPANHVEDVRAMVAAPSPAGVDEDDEYMPDGIVQGIMQSEEVDAVALAAKSLKAAGVDGLNRYEVFPYLDDDVAELDICEADDGSFVKYDAAQAIIDGLRGENERIRLNIAEYNEAISCYQSERDQQAQRIGELEGLLMDVAGMFHGPGIEGGPLTKLRRRIDAALSAVCAAAPNIATTSEHSGS